jgi:hypothetical protein
MPEDGLSEGIVTRNELSELAALFDQFEFAFDPLSIQAKEAESQFENRVRSIFDERISVSYPNVSLAVFFCRVKSACRLYLRKNPPE